MYKLLLILVATHFGFTLTSRAAMETIDSECRIQAKELAITTYQSCVKDSRTQKIEEIRKEYQSKLQELKSYYDSEMKKMSLSSKTGGEEKLSEKSNAALPTKKKNKVSLRMNSLPAKKAAGKSLPVRNIEPEIKIENTPTESATMSVEGSDADIVNTEDGSI